MTDIRKVKGVVAALSINRQPFGIRLAESTIWYNATPDSQDCWEGIQKGDIVNIEYFEDGNRNCVVVLEKDEAATHAGEAAALQGLFDREGQDEMAKMVKEAVTTGIKIPPSKDRQIIRQTCLKVAVDFVKGEIHNADLKSDAKAIEELAEHFEAWVMR